MYTPPKKWAFAYFATFIAVIASAVSSQPLATLVMAILALIFLMVYIKGDWKEDRPKKAEKPSYKANDKYMQVGGYFPPGEGAWWADSWRYEIKVFSDDGRPLTIDNVENKLREAGLVK
jgi:energy-coupling factor transporter transmembrane protein EcfT